MLLLAESTLMEFRLLYTSMHQLITKTICTVPVAQHEQVKLEQS
jgi:hypothetical protein